MPDYDQKQLIAITHEKVCDMHERLFGNGQPGEISTIRRRVASLEAWKWWVMGTIAGVGVVGSLLFRFGIL